MWKTSIGGARGDLLEGSHRAAIARMPLLLSAWTAGLVACCVLIVGSAFSMRASERLVVEPLPAPNIISISLSERCKQARPYFAIRPLPPKGADRSSLKRPRRLPAKYDIARIGLRGIGEGFNFYSIERENEIGRQLAKQAESEAHIVDDPAVVEYVNRITQNVVAHSDAKLPITITLIQSDDVNIYSMPGGFLFLNTGFLLAVESEAELAGAIAHEIAHTAARHATRNESRKRMIRFAMMPLSLVTGGASDLVIQPMAFNKFSRDAEREADLLGLEYTYAAGYDPAELVRFFERVRQQEGDEQTSPMSRLRDTHPTTTQRIQRAQQEIRTILPPKDMYLITSSDFDDMKASVISMFGNQHP